MESLLSLVDRAFCEGGVLSTLLPDYFPNPLQIDYANRFTRTLITGETGTQTSLTLLEGETGIGKTLAYLIPLSLYMVQSGRRALVSTYTLQLQNQMVQEGGDLLLALAVAEALTGHRPTYGIRKGMRNYVSGERAEKVVNRALRRASTGERQILFAFLEWVKESECGDLQEWMEQAGSLPKGVVASEVCLSPLDCSSRVVERYQAEVAASRRVDLLLVTHAMLILHTRQWLNHLGEDERSIELLVIDEGDRLNQAEEGLYAREIDLNGVIELAGEIEQGVLLEEQCIEVEALLTKVRNRQDRYLNVNRLSGMDQSSILDRLEALYQVSLKVMHLEGVEFIVQVRLHELLDDLREFVGVVRKDIGFDESNRLAVIDFRGVYPTLRLLPLETGRVLSRLWRTEEGKGLRSCLITSATLSGNSRQKQGGSSHLIESIGLPIGRALFNDNLSGSLVPDQFGHAIYYLPDPRIQIKRSAGLGENLEWRAYVVEMIQTAKQSGRVLVLTTSFQDSAAIAQRCIDSGVKPIVHIRGVKLGTLLPQFISQKDAVLISPIAWEGVDLPGVVDHLVIAKLPFVPPESPYLLAKEIYFQSTGRSRKVLQKIQYEYQMNQALRKFRQGLGRGIRRYDDRVTVWIADPRFPVDELKQKVAGIRSYHKITHSAFLACIPERFKSGPLSSWKDAKIFLRP